MSELAIPGLGTPGHLSPEEMERAERQPERERARIPGQIVPVGGNSYVPEPVTKFQHHLAEGQRVRLRASGRTGKLEVLNSHGTHHVSMTDHCVVLLDSGHRVQCSRDEIDPEDFPAPGKVSKAAGSSDWPVFNVGDRVKLKSGEVGRVAKVSSSHAMVHCGEGSGVESATICALEDLQPVAPLDAAAASAMEKRVAIPL